MGRKGSEKKNMTLLSLSKLNMIKKNGGQREKVQRVSFPKENGRCGLIT